MRLQSHIFSEEEIKAAEREEHEAEAEVARIQKRMLRSVGRSVRLGRWGVCPECRQGVERICRAITKQVQRSDARIEVDVMHTGNECTGQAQRMY
jgi:hypothetical protein